MIEQRGYKRVQSLARKLSRGVARAVEKYDHHVTRAKPKPEPVRKRLARVRAYARGQEAQRQLTRLVETELSSAGIRPASVEAAWTRVYARKLYRLLSQASTADPERLKHKLKQLEDWTAEVGIETLPVRALLRDRITALTSESRTR